MKGKYVEILPALDSARWTTVRDGVDRLVELLRRGHLDGAAIADIASRFTTLAAHDRWQVRKAIAEAVQYLHHDALHDVLARLIADDNAYVREAALRVRTRRSELIRTDVLKEQHDDLLMSWLAELEARHGTAARKDARRVAERYVEAFVRGARHEITNVIASIEIVLSNLATKLAKHRIDRTSCRGQLETAEARLRLLSGIVDSLREFTADVKSEFHRENLRDMIDDAVSLVKDSRRGKRWIEIDVTVDKKLRIDAHRHALIQAFQNVIRNAVEAYDGVRARTPIKIEARVRGHEVAVSVADGGCGMSPEVLRDAFLLYSTSKEDRGGTGFGLPLTKKIVKTQHGGRIDASSEKGRGTTITLVLRLDQDRRD